MDVKKCPRCGRLPRITECTTNKKGERVRMCGCPLSHSVIPTKHFNMPWFMFPGDGDDNEIFKVWNECIEEYEKRCGKC